MTCYFIIQETFFENWHHCWQHSSRVKTTPTHNPEWLTEEGAILAISFSGDLCLSECGLWTSNFNISWELVSVESQVLLQTCWVGICILSKLHEYSYARLIFEKHKNSTLGSNYSSIFLFALLYPTVLYYLRVDVFTYNNLTCQGLNKISLFFTLVHGRLE